MESHALTFQRAAIRVLSKATEYARTLRIVGVPNQPHFTDYEVFQLVICVCQIEKHTGRTIKVELTKSSFMHAVCMHLTDNNGTIHEHLRSAFSHKSALKELSSIRLMLQTDFAKIFGSKIELSSMLRSLQKDKPRTHIYGDAL
jgi:hypothetical protein